MTLLLGAFLMHGLVPGPAMLTKSLAVTYTMIWSLTLAHVIGAALCVFGSGPLARLSRLRPQLMLPVIVPIIFIAAFQGSRDFGDLLMVLLFGVCGWVMTRLGWPPLILGLVLGSTFERYLFISTEIYGARWLLRPVVLVILALIAWALFRPLKQLVTQFTGELRRARHASLHFGAGAAFSAVVVVLILIALVTSAHWPQSEQLVPRTAGYAALVVALLNLVSEVLGPARSTSAAAATHGASTAEESLPTALTLRRAGVFLAWLAGFVASVAVLGLVPTAVCFVFCYMALGFRESKRTALTCAAVIALFLWGVFDRVLAVPWPAALLGDWIPWLRDTTSWM
jgi:hypothetical protein